MTLLNAPLSLLPCGLFPGAAKHPFAQLDERVLMAAGHGIGQLAQLNGKLIQILAHGDHSEPASGCETRNAFELKCRGLFHEPPAVESTRAGDWGNPRLANGETRAGDWETCDWRPADARRCGRRPRRSVAPISVRLATFRRYAVKRRRVTMVERVLGARRGRHCLRRLALGSQKAAAGGRPHHGPGGISASCGSGRSRHRALLAGSKPVHHPPRGLRSLESVPTTKDSRL